MEEMSLDRSGQPFVKVVLKEVWATMRMSAFVYASRASLVGAQPAGESVRDAFAHRWPASALEAQPRRTMSGGFGQSPSRSG